MLSVGPLLTFFSFFFFFCFPIISIFRCDPWWSRCRSGHEMQRSDVSGVVKPRQICGETWSSRVFLFFFLAGWYFVGKGKKKDEPTVWIRRLDREIGGSFYEDLIWWRPALDQRCPNAGTFVENGTRLIHSSRLHIGTRKKIETPLLNRIPYRSCWFIFIDPNHSHGKR